MHLELQRESRATLTGGRADCFAGDVTTPPISWRFAFLLVAGVLLTGHAAGADAVPPSSPMVLRSCAAVRGASADLLRQSPRVELEAVITFAEPGANLLFVHDGTAGNYVYYNVPTVSLKAGVRLFVRGVAQAGLFTPVIFAEDLESRGDEAYPEAEKSTVARVNSGVLDSQWVELSGVVRRDGPSWLHRVLEVYDGDEPVYVRLKESAKLVSSNLLDALVVVRGVAANQFTETNRPAGYTLYVPDADQLRIVRPPREDPFAAPLVAANKLAAWHGVEQQGHLMRVKGVVLFQLPGRWLALQDQETPLIVESTVTSRIAPGTEIEAVGFVQSSSGYARLVDGLWRPTGATKMAISPWTAQTWNEIANAPPGDYVNVAGVLRGVTDREAVFQCDRLLLPVKVRDGIPADWKVGAEYRLTGIVGITSSRTPASDRLLWLADPASAELIRRPDRGLIGWLAPRDYFWVGLLVVCLAGWWWLQWRRKGMVDELEAALAFSRAQLVRAEGEQARIARDLHDGVIQSIYAVGMRLEECRRLTSSAPEAAGEKLATTSAVLNQVIRDMRGFLTGLEPASIQGRELKTALKSVLLGLGDEAADRIALEIDPRAAEALTSKEATELFHLCKEALSNSLRHGQASRVVVKLQNTGQVCRIEILDDGKGFDPEKVPPGARGLRNSSVRARNLGARWQLTTAPGAGTQIIVDLPKT